LGFLTVKNARLLGEPKRGHPLTILSETQGFPGFSPEPPAHCNVNACSAAYRSFKAADCTYQPSDGPRRLCSK